MTLFFREERAAIGDNETEVARACLIDAGKVDFIQNSVAEGEPNPAVQIEGGADARFCARGPARFDSRPAWSVSNPVTHNHASSPLSSLPEDADFCFTARRGRTRKQLSRDMLVTGALAPRSRFWMSRAMVALLLVVGTILTVSLPAVADVPAIKLNDGFLRLYDLDFAGAQRDFEAWEQVNPDNPMGPASEAAGILFSEFHRLGVLEAQFYEDDSIFSNRKKYEADSAQRNRFDEKLGRAESLANARLKRDAHDRDALLAMTLAAGLRSDFAALIEKRNLASLHYTERSDGLGQPTAGGRPNLLRRAPGRRGEPLHHRFDGRSRSMAITGRGHSGG